MLRFAQVFQPWHSSLFFDMALRWELDWDKDREKKREVHPCTSESQKRLDCNFLRGVSASLPWT